MAQGSFLTERLIALKRTPLLLKEPEISFDCELTIAGEFTSLRVKSQKKVTR
jgi:hypothetical protein